MKFSERTTFSLVVFTISLLATLAGIISLGIYGWQHLQFFASSSLWTDEFVSIDLFSSQGVWASLTEYLVPNNHILYNAVNALILQDGNLYDPLRARFLSFIALGASLAIVAVFFFGKKRLIEFGPLAGLSLIASMLASRHFLHLNLQARGYSLMLLALVVLIILLVLYLESGRPIWLYLMGLTVVLGQWSVPLFIGLGGSVLLFLFLFQRSRRTFLTGGITLALCIICYLPAWFQFYGKGGADIYRGEFSGLGSIIEAIQKYICPLAPSLAIPIAVLAFLPIGLAIFALRKKVRVVTPELVLMLSLVVFFLICISQQPHLRTVAFSSIAVCAVVSFSLARLSKMTANIIALALAVAISIGYPAPLDLRPIETWKGVAEIIEEWTPQGAQIFASRSPEYVTGYLDPEKFSTAETFDAEAFANSSLVIAETDYRAATDKRFDAARFPDLRVASAELPQMRFVPPGEPLMRMLFVPPHLEGITQFTQKQKPGAASGMTFALELSIDPGTRHRSLLIYAPTNNQYKPPKVKYKDIGGDGKWHSIKKSSLSAITTYTWKIDFPEGKQVSDLTMSLYLNRPAESEIPGLAVWLR